MKRLRIAIWIFFFFSLAAFVWYNLRAARGTDTAGPVISVGEETVEVSVEDGEDQMLAGVTATDTKDGDVTASLGIEKISGFTDEAEREIQIVAFDNDNHIGRARRKITYTDYTAPRLVLDQPLRFAVGIGLRDVLSVVHISDCLDGDLSAQVTITSDDAFNAQLPGDYPVTLEVTNSAGDKQSFPVTVTLLNGSAEAQAPKIVLRQNVLYLREGDDFDPLEQVDHVVYQGTEYALTGDEGTFAIDTSRMENDEIRELNEKEPSVAKDRIKTSGEINTEQPGVYEVLYSLSDLLGNQGTVREVVVVEAAG